MFKFPQRLWAQHGIKKNQLHNIKIKKKKETLGLQSLLREIELSYDVSSVFPGDSQTHWFIESQHVYLPGFIHFHCLIDFSCIFALETKI